jgi:hypothetical protein
MSPAPAKATVDDLVTVTDGRSQRLEGRRLHFGRLDLAQGEITLRVILMTRQSRSLGLSLRCAATARSVAALAP